MTRSAVTGLRCVRCGRTAPFDPGAYLCPECGDGGGGDPGILDVEYDYDLAGRLFTGTRSSGRTGVFRYLPVLPLDEPAPVLPAGTTALVPAPRIARRLGLGALYLKDETRNPTRCLKDRATSVGMALALEAGAKAVYCASAGNAAISLAGYAAHQGLACHVFVPAAVSRVRLDWLERFGARIHRSKGDYDQAFAESEAAGRKKRWYSRNCAFNPFLVEGKKTAGLEIGEQLAFEVPDLVVAPVGDGCTLAAVGKGFRELRALRRIGSLPSLLGVQAEGMRPLARRFAGEPPAEEGETAAASISVRRPRNALRLLREIRDAGGGIVAVSDEEGAAAQRALAEEAGIVAELTSALTLAAVCRMERELRGKRVVLVITGGRVDA
ncbi:MAG TPA: pyridoxal-phosphate dependent enzyme [Gemmatimonadales bacterium]